MAFTIVERETRHKTLQKMIDTNHLAALFLIGDTNVGPDFYGDLRYYADNRIIFYRQVALFFPQSEPVLFTVSEIQRQGALRRSSVKDCRSSDNLTADTTKLLKERMISKGRIGINLEMLPASWYLYLKQELPQIEWVEIHDQIMKIRFHRSKEEMEIYRKGGELGDGSFEAVLKMIRPGPEWMNMRLRQPSNNMPVPGGQRTTLL